MQPVQKEKTWTIYSEYKICYNNVKKKDGLLGASRALLRDAVKAFFCVEEKKIAEKTFLRIFFAVSTRV